MRTSNALVAATLLTGCGDPVVVTETVEWQQPGAGTVGRIECAAPAQAPLRPDCTIERTTAADGMVLTVRQADGGFRRLLVTRDGRGVVAADGAEAAKVSVVAPDRIEVAIGDARYRLPATVGPVARP